MPANFSSSFQDEVWQRLVTDIDDVVRIFAEQRDSRKQRPNLRLRLADLKVEDLKVQLRKQKYVLQHDLERLEERVRLAPGDEALCQLIALGTEHWTDIWILESLLERLTVHSDRRTDLTDTNHIRKLQAAASNEARESA